MAAKKKKTGLGSFGKKKAPEPQESTLRHGKQRRGAGSSVALTVRLVRSDWERLHQLAVSQGDSLQGLVVQGLSLVFADKGLPPMES